MNDPHQLAGFSADSPSSPLSELGTPPRVTVGPGTGRFAVEAVERAGGVVVGAEDDPDAVVWLDSRDMDGLHRLLASLPQVRWVQLPFAGVEKAFEAGLAADGRIWTCAKGSYAEPVAEHALMLALAGLRRLPERLEARSWGEQAGLSLFDQQVVIIGGGGIARALLELLRPLRVRATVVRRTPEPVPGAERTVATAQLTDVLASALVVFVALALTPDTVGIIGRPELAVMDERAWLVNVARGRHVDTEALVEALQHRSIGGAGLDVTDPEPLPGGHPLWSLQNCIITPHTADTMDMVRPLLAARISDNVSRFRRGAPLAGVVDASAGY